MNKSSHFVTPIAICFLIFPEHSHSLFHTRRFAALSNRLHRSLKRDSNRSRERGIQMQTNSWGKQCSCAETKVETEICTMSRVQSRLTRISTTRQTQLGVLVKYQSSLPNAKLLDVQRCHRPASSSFKSRDKYPFDTLHQTFVLRVDHSGSTSDTSHQLFPSQMASL